MRLIVGMSGATGAIYGVRLLEVLSKMPGIETHLVVSTPARETIQEETTWTMPQVQALATRVHDINDIGAPISSGSFRTEGMVIIPCSIKTLSAVAQSYNTNLLIRAADVCLKEKRRLVLVVRETPLHLGHLRRMVEAAEMGAFLLPPMPAFYNHPKGLEDVIDQTVGKVLDQFGIEHQLYQRWEGLRVRIAREDPD